MSVSFQNVQSFTIVRCVWTSSTELIGGERSSQDEQNMNRILKRGNKYPFALNVSADQLYTEHCILLSKV